MGFRYIEPRDLERWAETIISRQLLPEMIKDLIFAAYSRKEIKSHRFLIKDNAQDHGWDGELELDKNARFENSFIPLNRSFWEFKSSNGNGYKLLEEDYVKVTNKYNDTFRDNCALVLVTTDNLKNEDRSVNKKLLGLISERTWRQLEVWDAKSLADWLELYPAVALKHAIKIGIPINEQSVESVDSWWYQYVKSFRSLAINEELVLGGRESDKLKMLNLLQKHDVKGRLLISSTTKDQAIAFAISVIRQSGNLFLNNTILIKDSKAAYAYANSEDKIFIWNSDAFFVLHKILQKNLVIIPRVYRPNIPLEKTPLWSIMLSDDLSIELENIRSETFIPESFITELRRTEMSPERAKEIAGISDFDLTIVRRIYSKEFSNQGGDSEINDPLVIECIIVAALFGSWQEDNLEDLKIIERILPFESNYSRFRSILVKANNTLSIRIFESMGLHWKVYSSMLVFVSYKDYISLNMLQRFYASVCDLVQNARISQSLVEGALKSLKTLRERRSYLEIDDVFVNTKLREQHMEFIKLLHKKKNNSLSKYLNY